MVASNPQSDKPAETTPVVDAAAQTRTEAINALNREIHDHVDQQRQQSYLDKAIGYVASPFVQANSHLQNAKETYSQAVKGGRVSTADIVAATDADKKAAQAEHTTTELGSEFVKTGALFLRGRIGLATTLVGYGLSQARPDDSLNGQMSDFALGTLKGGALRTVFAGLGKSEMNFAAKGVLMGTSSRSIDLGLTKATWKDPQSGAYSLEHGLEALQKGALNKSALVSDVAVFGLAGGMSATVNRLTAGALERSPFLSTTFTGATFGATGGAYSEYQRQQQNSEKFDFSKIVGAAAVHATIDGVAAMGGGMQAHIAANPGFVPNHDTRLNSAADNLAGSFAMAGAGIATDVIAPRTTGGAASTRPGKPTDITIFNAIEGVEQSKRLAVWQAELTPERSGNLVAASNAIRLLPEADRLAAVEHTIKTSPKDAEQMLGAVDPERVADLTKAIFTHTSGEQRSDLLNRLYVGKSSPEAVRGAFEAASSAAGTDLQSVRSWMRDIPEPPAQWMSHRPPTPGKDALVANLDPNYVGRILFEGRENGVDLNRLSKEDPQLLSKLAQVTDPSSDNQMQNVARIVARWQTFHSLAGTAEAAISASATAKNGFGIEGVPEVLGALAGRVDVIDRKTTLDMLREAAIGGKNTSESQIWLASASAAQIAKIDPAAADANFFHPLVEAISDRNMDYRWRTTAARVASNLERTGEMPEGSIKLPELRMPALTGLSEAQKSELRSESEAALRDGSKLTNLIGDGKLGKLFPEIFGSHEKGGIIDRPQHEGHDFTLDKHTESVVQKVRDNPSFASLSEKDQTNLLWAALLHDVGKRPGLVDPGHEANSANISYGVLKTLGYSPTRIARIANLISNHPELGFQPEHPTETKLADQDFIDQAATKYSHPAAATQLRILNEADIRSVQANDNLWSEGIDAQIAKITAKVAARSEELTKRTLPVLTSELPQSFGIYDAPPEYALLGHVTKHLEGQFFEKLPVLESHEYSVSGSLLTPENSQLFDQEARIVPLFQGAPESVSQAYRGSTYSGESVGWIQHVEQFKDWAKSSDAAEIPIELNAPLSRLGFGNQRFDAINDLRRQLSQFDSIDELTAQTGPNSALSQGYRQVIQALTTDGQGNKIESENEVKLNNPTLVGLGIYRRGQNVVLEGASAADLSAILHGAPAPDWLQSAPNAVIVPKKVWQQLQSRNLPLIVLDP